MKSTLAFFDHFLLKSRQSKHWKKGLTQRKKFCFICNILFSCCVCLNCIASKLLTANTYVGKIFFATFLQQFSSFIHNTWVWWKLLTQLAKTKRKKMSLKNPFQPFTNSFSVWCFWYTIHFNLSSKKYCDSELVLDRYGN